VAAFWIAMAGFADGDERVRPPIRTRLVSVACGNKRPVRILLGIRLCWSTGVVDFAIHALGVVLVSQPSKNVRLTSPCR
jgi:hypothetical protein